MSAQNKIPCHCSGSARKRAACRDSYRCYDPDTDPSNEPIILNEPAVVIDAMSEHIADKLLENGFGEQGYRLEIKDKDEKGIGGRNKGSIYRLVKSIVEKYIK